jgi:3-methyladenine DNA glycosylase AlkD
VNILSRIDILMLRDTAPGTIVFGVSMRFTEAESGNNVANRLKTTLREMRRLAKGGDTRAKIEGMERFGIRAERPLGLTTPQIRSIARATGRNQALAEALWETGIYDARVLASLIGDPDAITRTTMDKWTRDFASWAVCDACCCNLFDRSPHAWSQIRKWAAKNDEFVRRAAFATIAAIAVHDKAADDQVFIDALLLIEKYAFDDRNFVKKALNWALRNIGKRNAKLCVEAIACAERVRAQGTPSARWIAADALREFKAKSQAAPDRTSIVGQPFVAAAVFQTAGHAGKPIRRF